MNIQSAKTLFNLIILAPLFLVGCASIELSQVEPEKLKVDVSAVVKNERQTFEVFLSRGIWSQPVKLDHPQDASIDTDYGERRFLNAARKDGRYGIELSQNDQAVRLTLEGVGQVDVPRMDAVILSDKEMIEGQAFFKTDRILLELNQSQADLRYLVFSTQCGGISAEATIDLSRDQSQYSLNMNDVMRRLNNSAEADLTGMLPIRMQLVEGAVVNWPRPFKATKMISIDSTDFFIDTSGFKITGTVVLKPSSAVSLLLTNRQWPVTYCY
jgi:hypothetical protein